MKEINDVMSQSSLNDSNLDPDLHPLPESSQSDTGFLREKTPVQVLKPRDLENQLEDSPDISDNHISKMVRQTKDKNNLGANKPPHMRP